MISQIIARQPLSTTLYYYTFLRLYTPYFAYSIVRYKCNNNNNNSSKGKPESIQFPEDLIPGPLLLVLWLEAFDNIPSAPVAGILHISLYQYIHIHTPVAGYGAVYAKYVRNTCT